MSVPRASKQKAISLEAFVFSSYNAPHEIQELLHKWLLLFSICYLFNQPHSYLQVLGLGWRCPIKDGY